MTQIKRNVMFIELLIVCYNSFPGYLEHLSREGDEVFIAHCMEYPPMPEKRFPCK